MKNKQFLFKDPLAHIYRKYGINSHRNSRQEYINHTFHNYNSTTQQHTHHNNNQHNDSDVPPLLDLSMQQDPSIIDTVQFKQTVKIIPQSTYNDPTKKLKKLAQSIYIQQQDQATLKNNNNSTKQTSAHQNNHSESSTEIKNKRQDTNYLIRQINDQEDNQQNSTLHNNLDLMIRLANKRNTGKMQKLTLQTYANHTLNNQYKYETTKQFTKIYKNRSPNQILKFLLINIDKAEKYLKFFIQQSISEKKIDDYEVNINKKLFQKYHIKGYQQHIHKKQLQKNKNVQVTKLLVCLLLKIKQSCIKNNQYPATFTGKNGQIGIDFSSSIKQQYNQQRLLSANKIKYERNKKQIKKLQQKLQQQDHIIDKIKYQYEQIISNYAETIQNLLLQQIKNKQSRPRLKKQSNYRQQKDNIMQKRVKNEEIELDQLILNKNIINPIQLFNRLSEDSKRKSRNNLRSQNFMSEDPYQI